MAKMNPLVYRLSEDGEYWEMHPHIQVQYRKVIDKQLEEWAKGNSLHSDELGSGFELPEGIERECCPDFSCCKKEMEWTSIAKGIFINAFKSSDTTTTNAMIMDSLFSLQEIQNNKIYLSGTSISNEKKH